MFRECSAGWWKCRIRCPVGEGSGSRCRTRVPDVSVRVTAEMAMTYLQKSGGAHGWSGEGIGPNGAKSCEAENSRSR